MYPHEIPEVVRGLFLRLEQLLESREDDESAEIALRTLYRLTRDEVGRPKYPNLRVEGGYDWETLDYIVDRHPTRHQ